MSGANYEKHLFKSIQNVKFEKTTLTLEFYSATSKQFQKFE